MTMLRTSLSTKPFAETELTLLTLIKQAEAIYAQQAEMVKTAVPAELCDNPYRPGEMPLPARAGPGRQMLLALNEDADWVLNVLANLGTKAPQLRAEAREQVLGDWIEEMVRGVRRFARRVNA